MLVVLLLTTTYRVAGSLARAMAAFHPLATSCKSIVPPGVEPAKATPLVVTEGGDDPGKTMLLLCVVVVCSCLLVVCCGQ